jgi:hypothetical protein
MSVIGFYDNEGNKLGEVEIPEGTYWIAVLENGKVKYVPIANKPVMIVKE